jgi:serine/threonine-protein kinase
MDAVGQLSAALAGRYVVDREIGRGGMATVYLARDVRHNRKVALKVLDPELRAVLGVERFLAEIQVTANLQHPNLLPLFDSGEADGLLFYVMPFIEGESLRAVLQREKQLSVEDAVHITTAVAGALDYAHRHGVIHRDLKPENILIHDGQPVVADFGIALAVSNAGRGRITQTGVSLGTPQYMSPEQATGDRVIDGRTDVYSLGAVAYEMLSGEPPHDGKTSQAIIAKVLTDRPRSIRLSRESVPPQIESAVMRALEKLPADRFHTAHEFASAMQGRVVAATATEIGAPAKGRTTPAWQMAMPWTVTILALFAAGIAWRGGRAGASDRTLRYELRLPPNVDLANGKFATVAIGPGGRFVAYVAERSDAASKIYVRADDDLEAREVPGTEGALSVSFSPDGSSLLFISGGALRKVPMSGGKVETIIDEGVAAMRGMAWTPSGWIIASDGAGLVKIPAVGGKPQPMTTADTAHGETYQINPVALPDGKTVLYTSGAMGGFRASHVGIASIDGTATILRDIPGTYPLGVVDGLLIFTNASGTLMAVPFDVAKRRRTGAAVALADQAAVSNARSISFAQMAADGSLVYVAGAERRQAVLVTPNGSVSPIGEPGPYREPRFSPDGKRIALAIGTLSQSDVWLMQLPGGNLTRLTPGNELNDRPEWKPDGSAVIYRSTRGEKHAIWTAPLDGGATSLLFGRPDADMDEGVLSHDSQHLIVQRDRTGNGETWVASLDGPNGFSQVNQAQSGFGVYGGRFSPDGKWVVFTSTQSNNIAQVVVKPFPGLTSPIQVSTTKGETPVWSPDGKRIYYVKDGQLMAATISSTAPFTIGTRSVVLDHGYSFANVHADYDVAHDGTIVAFQSPTGGTQLVVVRNIGAELRARVRAAPR